MSVRSSPYNRQGCTNHCVAKDVAANAVSVNTLCAQFETVINDTLTVYTYATPSSGRLTVRLDTTKSNSIVTFTRTQGTGLLVFLLPPPQPGVVITFVQTGSPSPSSTVRVLSTIDGSTPSTQTSGPELTGLVVTPDATVPIGTIGSFTNGNPAFQVEFTSISNKGAWLRVTCASPKIWLVDGRSVFAGLV